MSTQTPPEKMTAEETVNAFKEYLGVLHEDRPLSILERRSLITWISSALSHIEGSQADKEIVDYLDSKEVRLQWIDNACQPQPGQFREVIKEMIADSAMAAQTEGQTRASTMTAERHRELTDQQKGQG